MKNTVLALYWAVAVLPATAQSLLFPPEYTEASITSAAGSRPGRFATNTAITIYGRNLSNITWAIREQDIRNQFLPTATPNGEVYVLFQGLRLPLFYVSPTQINALLPNYLDRGPGTIRVFRDIVRGPAVTIVLMREAPEIFQVDENFAAATHADGSLLSKDSPAEENEIVVIYGTGFGDLVFTEQVSIFPQRASEVVRKKDYRVRIDGSEIPQGSILYLGVTPFLVGLFQLNMKLPAGIVENPTIQLGIDGVWSADNVRVRARIRATN